MLPEKCPEKQVGIIVDNYNLYKSTKNAQEKGLVKGEIDYVKLRNTFSCGGELKYFKVYITTSPEEEGSEGMKSFTSFLRAIGADPVTKSPRLINTDNGKTIKKGDLDVEMTVDILEYLAKEENHLDKIVLLSGDSDFIYLLQALKKKGSEEIVVASTKDSLAYDLAQEADQVYFLEEIWEKIKR